VLNWIKTIALFVVFSAPAGAQTYTIGGTIRYEDGTDMSVVTLKPTIVLDSVYSSGVSFMGGVCNYVFNEVPAGLHHVRIFGQAIAALDTMILVDHETNCGDSSGAYDFTVRGPLMNSGRELKLPTAEQTVLVYEYLYDWFHSGVSGKKWGTHTWTVTSSEEEDGVTTLQIKDVHDDSMMTDYVPPTPIRDSVTFTMTIADSSLTFGSPDITWDMRTIPRYCLSDADTLHYYDLNGDHVSYVDGVGIVSLHTDISGGNNHNVTELTLLEYQEGTPNSVAGWEPGTPQELLLEQNYPNPFNPTTTLTFSIPSHGAVRMDLYDVLGRLVQVVLDEQMVPGTYQVTVDGAHLTTGLYFCRLQHAGTFITRRLVVAK